ncbi:hypothetical protein [Actinoplanes solisilvae]|uniref:hypothetical protein n=1 Tax=Actinoplanes solisilvae TaxID=2486853 RepID=UPI000FDB6F6D|nr:hypothetical protein [Actinoplanes solisilvae]
MTDSVAVLRGLTGDLVASLCELPIMQTGAGRDGMIRDFAPTPLMLRERSSTRADIELIVGSLQVSYDGPRWDLLELIERVLPTAGASERAAELRRIRSGLTAYDRVRRPPPVHPSEVAQVHLFDLKRPVFVCAGSLPMPCRASVFVLATPTPKLLNYFCESLKQRGTEYPGWRREEVAPCRPALIVHPLHTSADLVVERLKRIAPELDRHHVILAIHATEPDDVTKIREGIAAIFPGTYPHHFVAVLGVPPGTAPPADVVMLPDPKFTVADVQAWVEGIGNAMALPRDSMIRWADVILADLIEDRQSGLPIVKVYERLDFHYGVIQEHRTEAELKRALDYLERTGDLS